MNLKQDVSFINSEYLWIQFILKFTFTIKNFTILTHKTQNTKYQKKIFLESQLQVFTSASRIFSAIFLSKSHYLWSPCLFRLDCFSDVFDFALCTGNNWNNFTVILELNIGMVYYTVSNSQQQSSVYVFEFKLRRIIIESKTRSH